VKQFNTDKILGLSFIKINHVIREKS